MRLMADTSRLYFRQILAGMDIAEDDPVAQQMVNFVYLIGDRETGEAVVVDPAYDPQAILDLLEADGMRLTGALGTHYHADHVGGSLMGHAVTGIAELLDLVQVPIHLQTDEVEWVTRSHRRDRHRPRRPRQRRHRHGGRDPDHPDPHAGPHAGQPVLPGRRPSSWPATRCSSTAAAAPTCPGSDPEEMYYSLTQRLAQVPDDAVLYPGHLYSEKPSASMAETRSRNVVFRPDSLEQWMMMFGS